jgi:polysaccharide export outer membrane protein
MILFNPMKRIFPLLLFFLVFVSCSSKKNILYFQDINTDFKNDVTYGFSKIQINDILSIRVSALVPETAIPYNQSSDSNSNVAQSVLKLQGYLVNPDGNIVFPLLGNVSVAGKTITEVADMLRKMFNDLGHIKDATVNVRVVNAKVTILGEVNTPGTYEFTEQNITIPQALGFAGDLTIRGKRRDVLVIREEDGIRVSAKIDLTNSQMFKSPFYYVKQNDVIVVNQNGPRVMNSGYFASLGTFIGLFSSALAFIVLLIR